MVSMWWDDQDGAQGGEAVPLEQILVVLLSSLAFWKTQGLIPHRYFSPVMPLHSPLVTIFVFQVDDINADKNVSSAQIIGPGPKPQASAKPPSRPVDTYDNFVLPELPSVPDTLPTASAGASTSASEDIDFDDLSRRFEELKKKT